jgi:hypothetical protein
MDKSNIKRFSILKIIKRIRKFFYILLAASMIGFSNAYNNEYKMLNDIRCFMRQEQVINDDDKYK